MIDVNQISFESFGSLLRLFFQTIFDGKIIVIEMFIASGRYLP